MIDDNQSPESTPSTKLSNVDFAWEDFDALAYFKYNYAAARAEDLMLTKWTAKAIKPINATANVVDVGTGSNLFPLLCTLPKTRTITAWEYGQKNIDWLRDVIQGTIDLKAWLPFWKVIREIYSEHKLPLDFQPILTKDDRIKIVHDSIFNLPSNEFDAATMFFCAESITQDMDEFTQACNKLTESVVSGGIVVAAFMKNSAGYTVNDIFYPAVSIDAKDLENVFGAVLEDLIIRDIPLGDNPIRSGYSGILFLSGKIRA